MTNLSKKYDQMNNNLDILDSQDISLQKQLEKDAAAFREEKFRPEPEQYTELLDTRIQIRPDFRDKLIEQLKGTFGKYYDYHRCDIAANEFFPKKRMEFKTSIRLFIFYSSNCLKVD